MKYEKIRKTVLEAILEAVDQGLIHGTSGNIAMRDDEDDVIAITPSGISYTGMKPEMGRWTIQTVIRSSNAYSSYACQT